MVNGIWACLCLGAIFLFKVQSRFQLFLVSPNVPTFTQAEMFWADIPLIEHCTLIRHDLFWFLASIPRPFLFTYTPVPTPRYLHPGTYTPVPTPRYLHPGTYTPVPTPRYLQPGTYVQEPISRNFYTIERLIPMGNFYRSRSRTVLIPLSVSYLWSAQLLTLILYFVPAPIF